MRKDKNTYVNVISGERITDLEYSALGTEEKGEYDRITSARKARAAMPIEDEEE